MRLVPWFLASFVLLASCAKLGLGTHTKPDKPASPFGATGIPPQLRAKSSTEGNAAAEPVSPGPNKPNPATALKITPDEDIVFTDPDNPDAKLPELSTMLSEPKRGPWEDSATIAKQRAAREGKPLLIWFTDSARSPMCKALSQELFSTPAFEAWANEKLVRLRIDAQAQVNDPNLSLGEKETKLVDIRDYVTRMKKTYKILGYPSCILLNPAGEVIGRYRGYKRGDAEVLWGQLKQGEAVSANAYQEWRKSLEKKGYREWHDRKGHKVMAKLVSYANGTLILIEPDGTRARTRESSLSDQDQQWIAQQKKTHGIE